MAREQVVRFLETFYTDRELQLKIIEGYRQAMCDVARRAGFLFTVAELRHALREEGSLNDDMLEQVAGGQSGTTVLSNANQASQLILSLLR